MIILTGPASTRQAVSPAAHVHPPASALSGVPVLEVTGSRPDRAKSHGKGRRARCGRGGSHPLPASSGQTQRHRLNRGGTAKRTPPSTWISVCRVGADQRAQGYIERRAREGVSKREVMRCLKRYVAREVYRVVTAPSPA